jgi:hypothetical protein
MCRKTNRLKYMRSRGDRRMKSQNFKVIFEHLIRAENCLHFWEFDNYF